MDALPRRIALIAFRVVLPAFVFLSVRSVLLAQSPTAMRGSFAKAAEFYVAPNGNDTWSGTLDAPNAAKSDGPFATLDRARKAVRSIKASRNNPIRIMLRGGTYFLPAPVTFDEDDSGTLNAPVIYQAYSGEKPVISGGRPITGWSNSSGNVWTVKLNSTEYQKFEALFFNDERRYRPRTTENGYLYIDRPVITQEQSDACDQPPNRANQGGQGRHGPGAGPGPFGGRRFPGGPGMRQQRPYGGGENGFVCFDRFRYKGDDIAPNYHGMALGDVEVLDFEKWTMARLRLRSVDTSQHIAYMTGETFHGSQISGFFPNHRYLIENVKEALKKPGQWYLDRCTDPPGCTTSEGVWTLTYLAKPGEDPNRMPVIVPQVPRLIVAEGLRFVTFKGLTFSHDNWLPGPEGLGDFQGGPRVPAALSFRNCNHIVFDGDIVDHIQAWAIDFFAASNGNQVLDSAIYDIGYGAIRIGRRAERDDTDDNVPSYTTIDNNVIEGGGRIQPSGIGTGVWVGNAHHNTVSHNDIYDFYNGAIRIGFQLNVSRGVGNAHDNVVSFNRLWNLGQGVTSDMGGIYFANSDTKGNQVLNNVIHDVVHDPGPGGYGGEGLYFDQGASNIVAKNNLVYRVSQAALFINFAQPIDGDTPQNNVITNNIFAFPKKWFLQRGGDNKLTFTLTHNILVWAQGRIQASPGKWSCYGDCPSRFLLDYNLYWNPKGGKLEFITTEPEEYREPGRHDWQGWQGLGEDTHSIIANPQFADPNYPADDFTLKPGSPASQIGFVPFDAKQAGRTDPVLKPPSVPPAFPLQVPDPGDL
jgi:hypothetical protein